MICVTVSAVVNAIYIIIRQSVFRVERLANSTNIDNNPNVNDMDRVARAKLLLAHAEKVRANAYSPYANYHVGAAIMTASGDIFVGTNVENAAHLSICAEKNAVGAAVAAGHREL